MNQRERQELLHSFGNRLRELRQATGLSQEKLAFAAAVDRTYIGGIERGERNVSLVNLSKIAKALGTNISKLTSKI